MSYCTFQRLNKRPITGVIDENSLTCCNYQLRSIWIEAQIIYAAIERNATFNEQKYWQTYMLSNVTVNFVLHLPLFHFVPIMNFVNPHRHSPHPLQQFKRKFLFNTSECLDLVSLSRQRLRT